MPPTNDSMAKTRITNEHVGEARWNVSFNPFLLKCMVVQPFACPVVQLGCPGFMSDMGL